MEAPNAAFQVLTAMITPAVLISACGTLVFSTSSRLSRVVDRVRTLADSLEKMLDQGGGEARVEKKKALYLDQLKRLSKRVLLLRSAMTSFYLAIGFFVTTSIAVGIIAITTWRYGWIPVVLGLIGSCVLLYGSVLLIQEARLAVSSTLIEMAFVSDEMDRHTAD